MKSMRSYRNPFRLNPIAAALCAGVGSLATPALAQDAAEGATLPTVSVTAPEYQSSPKATAPLVDTPQTITVVPKEVYNQQGARNLSDVLRNTPGITYNAGENGFSTGPSNFSIRGFESGANIFIDGVRDSGNYSRDIFNVEQVEIVKGPSADNGRGGAGGYVNLVTKTPRATDFYNGTLSYGFDATGSESRVRGTADLNKAFNDGAAALRLNLLWQDGGVAGREYAEQNALGVAPSLAFGLNTDTRLIFSYQHTRQDDIPDWGVPGALLPGLTPSQDIRHDQLPAPVETSNFYGLVTDFDDTKSDAVMARIEHDFSPNLRISNQTRYSKTDRLAVYTNVSRFQTFPTVTASRQAFDRETTTLSNQTNLTVLFDTGAFKHTVATGVEFSREESESGRFADTASNNAHLGTVGGTDIFNPDPFRPLSGGVDLTPDFIDKVKIDTVAGYAYDTIQLNPKWQVSGGFRVERYSVRIDSNDPALNPPTPYMPYERDETTLGGKLGVVYKPAENGSIYAGWGVSALPPGSFLSTPDISRPGGQNFPTLSGQNFRDAKEQRQINYEIGTKWDLFDQRLSTGVALFRTERENIAMAPVNGVPTGYGEQHVQGVELSAAGAITPAWSVFFGVLYQDSERRHSAEIDAALRAANPADYGTATSTNGDELAFTPHLTANLWTTYRFSGGIIVGAGMQYVGESYVGRPDNVDRVIKNGVNGKMPDYTIYNAMVAYEATKNLTIRFNVDNITDEVYGTSANWSARRVILGAPRSYLLSADLAF